MSHCIEKPIDEVFSNAGVEWHGLATHVTAITDAEVNRLCPIIHEMPLSGTINGKQVTVPNYKALVADYSVCRPETAGTEFELVPLHIPKSGYGVINNCELYRALKDALKDVDAEVTTAGTLGAGKRCFFSVNLRGDSEMEINGDKFLAYLNFITSHDGTLAASAYDSTTRVVCQNTLNWSLEAAGDVGFKVYHTQGASAAVSRMGELLNAILAGRVVFKETMERLASVSVTAADAERIAAGYFVFGQSRGADKLSYELSTRTRNAIEGIAGLFANGIGNHGNTAYDLANGATQYWTSGDGTGKKASKLEKVAKGLFGTAAEHKQAFVSLLVGNRLEAAKAAGEKALTVSVKD